MSKYLFFEPLGGVSGDMVLSSLIDLGVPLEYIEKECGKLKLTQEYKLMLKADVNQGFSGSKFFVKIKENGKWVEPELLSSEGLHEHHVKEGEKHAHDSEYSHSHEHAHNHNDHSHHHYKDIRELISVSSLSKNAIEMSLKVFDRLAYAEAKIHGKSKEEVAFHEVGAVDSIIDIVGSCIAIDYLKIEKIYCNPIAVGSGHVHCAHGKLPLPAPATLELLKGFPILHSGEKKEMCTPTGAAILTSLASFENDNQVLKPIEIGYGLSHTLPKNSPPYLRVTLSENKENENYIETLLMIHFNIDDMNPEYLAPLSSKFLELGALDVSVKSILMKKNRHAQEVSVLIRPSLEKEMIDFIFKNTSTFGVRKESILRESLERKITNVTTPLGDVRVKKAVLKEYAHKHHIEFEDIYRISHEHNMSLEEVVSTVEKCL